jgi:hypothetical protein
LQTRLEKLKSQRFLLFSLASTGIAILIAEYIGKETAIVFTNWIFVPIPGAMLVLSIIMAKKHGVTGNHGRAWIAFAVFSACWFVAEQVWLVEEIFYHQKPFPSAADFFYIVGYPAYFIFAILYLKPFRNSITKKMIILSSLVSIAVLIPSMYWTLENNSGEDQFSIILGASYPIADSIVLVPSLIGVRLFFGGKVNFLWSLMLVGILVEVVADTGFQYFSLDNSIYTGHPVDILFLWSYILFSFGVYDNIKVFKSKMNSYKNPEDLR